MLVRKKSLIYTLFTHKRQFDHNNSTINVHLQRVQYVPFGIEGT